jgi:hypothetical protein
MELHKLVIGGTTASLNIAGRTLEIGGGGVTGAATLDRRCENRSNSHVKLRDYAAKPLMRAFPLCTRGILLFRARDWRGARQPQAA